MLAHHCSLSPKDIHYFASIALFLSLLFNRDSNSGNSNGGNSSSAHHQQSNRFRRSLQLCCSGNAFQKGVHKRRTREEHHSKTQKTSLHGRKTAQEALRRHMWQDSAVAANWMRLTTIMSLTKISEAGEGILIHGPIDKWSHLMSVYLCVRKHSALSEAEDAQLCLVPVVTWTFPRVWPISLGPCLDLLWCAEAHVRLWLGSALNNPDPPQSRPLPLSLPSPSSLPSHYVNILFSMTTGFLGALYGEAIL
ncbi:hypothetical protein BC939DRAFT_520582 [Gamsiella multidivaricata]|uniref:uncharacterized protein n=1 Tax=Gamsiella multidivaricata TaxID=101098 RepID=UPI00221F9265|nr:uncharacterized protein BC939DRAFT_520582 [Gamsiella multidivaricata]KAI7830628.1 hypothetical protein BC939DRAFT_520582 [Gamsiella multidivaricata]